MSAPTTRQQAPKPAPVPVPRPVPAIWMTGLAGVVVILLLFVAVVI